MWLQSAFAYADVVLCETPHPDPSAHSDLPSRPEVLAPAGNLATLKVAIDYGADAVYCGGKAFGMRSAPRNFSLSDFESGLAYAHKHGARLYVTANILPDSCEVEAMNAYIGQLADIGIDALIVTDIGVLMAARSIAPNLELHVSTQAGVTNYQAATALQHLGARRVVLARELSLEQIRQMRARISPELEIEAFVHGSMCMAFSGRCLISKHLVGRDANHGDCVQPCRWKYHVVEEKRPGEFLPIEVSDEGTFIFNSTDMNMLEHVDSVIEAGVSSLKIEGRAKGAYYVASMANAYKTAVLHYLNTRGAQPLPQWLVAEPFKVTHRAYSTGFYYSDNPASEEIVRGGYINDWRLLGTVLKCDLPPSVHIMPSTNRSREVKDASSSATAPGGRLHLRSNNKITPGMTVEILIPGGIAPVVCTVPDFGLLDAAGVPVFEINNPAHDFSMPIPCELEELARNGELPQGVPAGAMIRAQVR